MRTQMPISGRLSTISIRLPIHMLTIMPQNRPGFCSMTWGPGTMPWIIMPPIIIAITALEGMPSVSMGMNEVCAAALLAASGAATPSIMPVPNFSGVRESLFSTV